jgi:hypothetical protein
MKHKVSELEGALLDAAVALTERRLLPFFVRDRLWSPSTVWEDGGPIIECEGIALMRDLDEAPGQWAAYIGGINTLGWFGPTPLIAAMRAYVASRLGDEVELQSEAVSAP